MCDINNVPPIPKNYRDLMDQSVYNIAKEVQRIIPIIEELGNSLQIDVEDYIVEIKRKYSLSKEVLKTN